MPTMLNWIQFLIITTLTCMKFCDAKNSCNAKDFHDLVYTECQANDRWVVAVPKAGHKSNECTGTFPVPISAKCVENCDSGMYLDISEQKCKECPAGTFSMGGTALYDDWRDLPHGFYTTAFPPEESLVDSNCSNSKWQSSGEYIALNGAACRAELVLRVDLIKPGSISFEYRYSDPSRVFEFLIENDRCEVTKDDESDKRLHISKDNLWKSRTFKLKSGRNNLYWISYTYADENEVHTPILLRKVEVSGVAFTPKCSECPVGTYSSQKSSRCTPCARNWYSNKKNSIQCDKCSVDEYSDIGADKCLSRKNCVKTDYYEFMDLCNEKNKTRTAYAWKFPKICKEVDMKLPAPGPYISCSPCNPGSQRVNATSPNCQFCPAKEYSDGNSICKKCGKNTQPRNEIRYTRWASLPPNLSTECLNIYSENMDACDWHFFQDHIRSSDIKSDQSVYRILTLKIPGFQKNSSFMDEHQVVGKLSVNLEVVCAGECRLLLMMKGRHRYSHVLKMWKNEVKRITYEYEITDSATKEFAWVFDSNSEREKDETQTVAEGPSYVAIYSLNVTGLSGVGATGCEECPLGVKNNNCIPCPSGQYYCKNCTKKCISCPDNQIVIRYPAQSINDCAPCGIGLKSSDSKSCLFQSEFITKDNYKYNFNKLLGVHNITGVRLFSSRGASYYHVFNFTLDNQDPKKWPVCSSSFRDEDSDGTSSNILSSIGLNDEVKSLICRVTIVPNTKKVGGVNFRGQPMSLGERLISIKNTNYSIDFQKEINKKLETAGWSKDDNGYDVHVEYGSSIVTAACPKGRTTIITLRCSNVDDTDSSQEAKAQNLQLPPKCSMGTCDGCNFHFMWFSQNACPVCRKEDFTKVLGECAGGKQTIHYIPSKHCYFSKGDHDIKQSETVSCPFFSRQITIGLGCGAVLCVILLGTIIHCHKSKKQLQYKYSKLVESSAYSGGKDGELPGAESCAVHEGEEEDDDIQVKTSSGGAFFSRIKNIRRPNRYSNDQLESVNLTDKMDYNM